MSRAQQITRHYKGDWHGSYGTIPAPGHSGADRGVTVKDADNGGVIFNSFNGGDWRTLKDECRDLGLLPERERGNDNGARWRETGGYDYVDGDGVVAYRTVRLEKPGEPKRFVAKRPDGRGGWVNGLGDVERVLYRLPDILAADPTVPVYLVEGERKADKLAAWGLTATAVAFGCKGWRSAYAQALGGRTVIILPDNDQVGRGFAEQASQSLRAVHAKPLIVNLPGLPEKGDIIDWTGTAEDLAALVASMTLQAADAPKLLDRIDPASWLGVETPPREWALHEWIPARQATYLTGAGSAGKSLMTQQLCTCIALGLPFMGIDTAQATAVYITCEDDADELHRRQKAICDALGVSLSALSGKLHLVSLMGELGNELITFDDRDHASPSPRFAETLATAKFVGAGFVALDNVAHLTPEEIARNKVAAFVGLLNRLAKDIDGSVLFLGHPNKTGDPFSGSTAWENQVRSRLFLETAKEADGSVMDPDLRELSRGKANYARNGEALRFRWHKWAFVRDEDLPDDIGAEIAANIRASAENDAFLKCLAKATEEKRATSTSKSASNWAPRVFAKMTIGKGFGERGFEKAMERLLHLGTIRNGERVYQRDNRAWVTGLGVPSEVAPTLAPTPAQTDARGCTDHAEKADVSCTDLPALTPIYTTYISGAPLGAGAPSREEKGASVFRTRFPAPDQTQTTDLSRVRFPAEEVEEVRRLLRTPTDDEWTETDE